MSTIKDAFWLCQASPDYALVLVTKRGRGEPVARHEWLARTVRMAKPKPHW